MKLLLRDTSAYRFMVLGGLLSRKQMPELTVNLPPSLEKDFYRRALRSFGPDERNVEKFLMDMLKNELKWSSVQKSHDILVSSNGDKLLIECKNHNSRLLYLDEHKGGAHGESGIEELHRNLKTLECKWGILTDGATFRLYYNSDTCESFSEAYLEISLIDIQDSTETMPYELELLIDILSPNSRLRQIDPSIRQALKESDVKRIVRVIKDHGPSSLRPVLKSLAIAALEDMGVRPLHTGLISIRSVSRPIDIKSIFDTIPSDDPDFHHPTSSISAALAKDIHGLFNALVDVDFANVDHEFFGLVYQKFINNGNASHYTNTHLSREMANYISCRNDRTQIKNRRVAPLGSNDHLLDPAMGSGQLLRGLLPFHKVFFSGSTSGIDGWRQLASRFIGRDVDAEAIWVAKVNLWLSTAKKGGRLLSFEKFAPLDVISATINRRAGETIKEALNITGEINIAGCVSNPPWDAFKNDRRRGVSFDKEEVEKIKRSLDLESRQLNRAQIFARIIEKLGTESGAMRFAIILPDSFFVDINDKLRAALGPSVDFYFSYPRNIDPVTGERVFADVDLTRKFGIIFGRSDSEFETTFCYPFGRGEGIAVTEALGNIGAHTAFPLFSNALQAKIVTAWKLRVSRFPVWHNGEFDQTMWANKAGRTESASGRFVVVGGRSFCREDRAWSANPDAAQCWKRMSSVAQSDRDLRGQDRVVFSDYINNSKKLNSATFFPGSISLNLTNTVVYSTDCVPTDALLYDSPIFSTFVEVYGTSQHMNSWRLTALGLPPPVATTDPLQASAYLAVSLGLTVDECRYLFKLNQKWMTLDVSEDQWMAAVLAQQPSQQAKSEVLEAVQNLRQKAKRKTKRTVINRKR